MHDKYPKGSHIYLIAILIAATIITIISTVLTYKNSLKAAEDSLKLQTLGIAVSLEASMSKGIAEKENIFRDIITASCVRDVFCDNHSLGCRLFLYKGIEAFR